MSVIPEDPEYLGLLNDPHCATRAGIESGQSPKVPSSIDYSQTIDDWRRRLRHRVRLSRAIHRRAASL